jgi:prepilin-type N-terminal cleavage/methylation domain-containing protein
MKNPEIRGQRSGVKGLRYAGAFTLIELLVVIAIIALMAAMIFPIAGAVNRHKMTALARASRAQMELLIESYHSKIGSYPPADTNNPALNPLFYELGGTTLDDNTKVYTTKDGSAKIDASSVSNVFGSAVGGFINSTRGAGGDEGRNAQNFLKAGLKESQFMVVTNGSGIPVTVLGLKLDGPIVWTSSDGKMINPWRYNMATPTNNPKTYDLWIDVTIGGKPYRVSNWSQQPQRL